MSKPASPFRRLAGAPALCRAGLLLAAGVAVMIGGCRAETPPAVPAMPFSITGIASGQPIPAQFTCDGAGLSPAIGWGQAPASARSLALVVDDPDAPSGLFGHWGAFDIDPRAGGLSQGAGNTASAPLGQPFGQPCRQARNSAGGQVYKGPCPPPGNGAHHYRFKLYALDIPKLDVGPDVGVNDLEGAMGGHVVAQAMVTATYARQ